MHKKLSTFQTALVDAVLDDFADVPCEQELDLAFSPEFESRSRELIDGSRQPLRFHASRRVRRFILVAAILSALITSALAIPAVREAIIDFFFTSDAGTYGITFDEAEAASAPREIVEVYGPTWIPEGFELAIEDVSAAGAAYWYANTEDHWICFTQYIIMEEASESDWFGVNAEETGRSSMLLGDYRVEEIRSKSVYFWFWTDNRYLYSLEISNEVPEAVAEEVFHSIAQIDGQG